MVCNKCIKNYKKAKLEFIFTDENGKPTCKTWYLQITYQGNLKCVDFFKINAITNQPDIKWVKGEIQIDNVRNTLLISMAEGTQDGSDDYPARSIILKKLKNCYRGDVIDTKFLYGEGSIANFKFI